MDVNVTRSKSVHLTVEIGVGWFTAPHWRSGTRRLHITRVELLREIYETRTTRCAAAVISIKSQVTTSAALPARANTEDDALSWFYEMHSRMFCFVWTGCDHSWSLQGRPVVAIVLFPPTAEITMGD
ncbi:hypothetical protein J6590_053174 [Homalodisca vitripennis]|nr:hypothetical protein J6590_053174 [Homalodisca vitripennis]